NRLPGRTLTVCRPGGRTDTGSVHRSERAAGQWRGRPDDSRPGTDPAEHRKNTQRQSVAGAAAGGRVQPCLVTLLKPQTVIVTGMKLTPEDVLKLGSLSRISIDAASLPDLQADLNRILEFAAVLQEVDGDLPEYDL